MSQTPLLERNQTVFINGVWSSGTGHGKLTVTNPSTHEAIAKIPTGGPQDVESAAKAAANAFAAWKTQPSSKRAAYLMQFAAGLTKRLEALVHVQMLVSGKPKWEAEIDIGDAIATFEYYAGLAEDIDASQDETVAHRGGDHIGRVRFEPIGPVGLIVPWNFPLVTSAWKIAPALAAGCTVVLKPSEVTPLIELVYADIALEIGLPEGVLNIVTGEADVGKAMTATHEFRKVSFTGSNAVGAKVMQAVSDRCLPVALELGGKSPIIVTEDADFETALDAVIGGIYFNAGQICSATSRLIVHKSIEDDFVEALIDRTHSYKVGCPFSPDVMMGPITTRPQFDKIKSYFVHAQESGLNCITGGTTVDESEGNFLKPTIYRNVPHKNRLWDEEVFGPILATTTFNTDKEALSIANDTHYGLVGSIVCADPERANALCNGIVAGHIWLNTPQIVYPDSAWGGFKSSGIGRELGPSGLRAYQGLKHVTSPAS